MISVLLLASALTPSPTPRSGSSPTSRRAALQTAAALTLPSLATVMAPGTAVAAPYKGYDERSGFSGSGALRSDVPVSLTGSSVEILIEDMTYKELSACPTNYFIPPKGGPWSCIEVSATATNQGKRKVNAAEVFGIISDAEGFACASTALDASQKTPLASLQQEFPKGKSVPVKWVTAVQSRSPKPFTFRGMKADYRSANMEKTFQPFDACEIDSSACAEDEDQPSNANALREGKGFRYD